MKKYGAIHEDSRRSVWRNPLINFGTKCRENSWKDYWKKKSLGELIIRLLRISWINLSRNSEIAFWRSSILKLLWSISKEHLGRIVEEILGGFPGRILEGTFKIIHEGFFVGIVRSFSAGILNITDRIKREISWGNSSMKEHVKQL